MRSKTIRRMFKNIPAYIRERVKRQAMEVVLRGMIEDWEKEQEIHFQDSLNKDLAEDDRKKADTLTCAISAMLVDLREVVDGKKRKK